MSRRYGIWKRLGIDRTSDTGEIRRAYARSLKAMDVDADPHGFQALREAREQALAQARFAETVTDGADEAHWDANEWGAADWDDAAMPASGPPPLARESATDAIADAGPDERPVDPRIDDHAAAMDRHYRDVLRLLFETDGDTPYLGEADAATLAAHVEVLLADPRLDGIDFRREAETWFGDIAAAAIPRSDPIIPRITDFFGWAAERGRIDQPPPIARCVTRRDSLKFHDLVLQPRHKYHREWRLLSEPAPTLSWRNLFVTTDSVRRLLHLVRRHFPDLEACFDPHQVALWEGPAPRNVRWRPIWLGIVIVFLIFRLAVMGEDAPSPRPASVSTPFVQQLGDKWADMDFALARVTGGTMSYNEIQQRNPRLDAHLTAMWQAALARHDERDAFVAAVVSDLQARYRGGVYKAPRIVLLEMRKLERDRLAALRVEGGTACSDVIRGKPVPDAITQRFVDPTRLLVKDVLLSTFATPQFGPSPAPGKVMIPGAVMQDAAARAMLTHDELSDALSDRASPAQVCDARIALLDAVIALPGAEGTRLLREL